MLDHVIRFSVNPARTQLKCFLDDGRVYLIEFKKDEDKDSIRENLAQYEKDNFKKKKTRDNKKILEEELDGANRTQK